jgi:hypothetical protein
LVEAVILDKILVLVVAASILMISAGILVFMTSGTLGDAAETQQDSVCKAQMEKAEITGSLGGVDEECQTYVQEKAISQDANRLQETLGIN